MLNFLTQFNRQKFKIQSFTYFIPAPPSRTSGYREKQFDKIFYEFINKGYRILNFQCQSINSVESSGIWLVFIVQAINEEASKLNIQENIEQILKNNSHEIDGLYYIND